MGYNNYSRLTVPAGLWLAFKGEDDGMNLILNIASIPHDPSESINKPIEEISLSDYACENIIDGI